MDYTRDQAQEDFTKARKKEKISRLLTLLDPNYRELMSLYEIKAILRPKSESYLGMKAVPVDKIVGSEGRYRDFNKAFFPKHDRLRGRWESIDQAHLKDVILPPIQLYKLGDIYFVRDGNHRVSVAKMQGVLAIDAEIVEMDSELDLTSEMTTDDIRQSLINYEKKKFLERTGLGQTLDCEFLRFSAPGRYDEIESHINVHKYFINQEQKEEMSLIEAANSWYENIFLPIIQEIDNQGLMGRFPGRTKADIYVWIVSHWHILKEQYGEDVSITDATKDYSKRYGEGLWRQTINTIKKLNKRIKTYFKER